MGTPPSTAASAAAAVELSTEQVAANTNYQPARAVGRYEVLGELGRGGMACVYRVRDPNTGEEVALKQLTGAADLLRKHEAAVLFEREYHTLTHLAHPRVIRVFDFGTDAAGPFYTMELLDGGDLRERSPLPWREACELVFDVCSSLALLHSRRLVHRDVSPRNVRCTRDGHAKLIDFGAMVPMGAGAQLVGTAPFVAPEALYGGALDARTDLFSLGCTLYFALTGRLAFPARDFSQLLTAWTSKPAPPSAYASDVPAALDSLVASLISLEPALRPRSAFEVMQRLATLADIQREEPLSVGNAYLVTPTLVGRDAELAAFREHLLRAQHGAGRALLFHAPAGSGRSRMLDACALGARMAGALLLRANVGNAEDFATARALATQALQLEPEAALAVARDAGVFDLLFETASTPGTDSSPDSGRIQLKSFARPVAEQAMLQRALSKWLLQLGKRRLVAVVVDDVEQCDDASLALLVSLADRARTRSLLVIASTAHSGGRAGPGLQALWERARRFELRPLSLEESEQLLGSVFGDVPNLTLVNARIHAAAGGSPRETMALVQLLIDRAAIQYREGAWSLPFALAPADLPQSGERAFELRLRTLSALARRLAESQALAEQGQFSREDYRWLLPDIQPAVVDDAVDELIAAQLVDGDGQRYRLTRRAALEALCAELDPESRRQHHADLAQLYEKQGHSGFATARQLLLAGAHERCVDVLMPLLRASRDRAEFAGAAALSVAEIGRTLAHALQVAQARQRTPSDCHEIRRWLLLMSVADDDALYWLAAPDFRAQLERDSGLLDHRALPEGEQRLMHALQAAAKRYNETPQHERVYPVDQAIRLLVHYVAISIAIGARTLDAELLLSLPGLLEPFAPLSPLLAAIWQNALATCEASCHRQPERACERWRKVYDQLGEIDAPDPQLVKSIRNAIAYGIGSGEASLGLQQALHWAEILDRDPLQKVSAMYLRKVTRLQQGDLEGAERYRKQAELLSLQSNMRQMFTSLLMLELGVHFAAWDLAGVKHIGEQIEVLASRSRGWVPFRELADAHYQRLRGDLVAACAAYERCLKLSEPDPRYPTRNIAAWPQAAAAHAETLLALGRSEDAKRSAERAWLEAERRELGAAAHEICRAYALAEAKLGEHARAAARLDELIEKQRALGVTGLNLGASYEARTRVAIWAGDRASVEHFGRLMAEQFRHGHGSTLGARYERVMDEARAANVVLLPALSPFETTIFGGTELSARAAAIVTISRAMQGTNDPAARAKRALELVCKARGARGGHLYLPSPNGLQLVATYAANDPDEVIGRLVNDFWAQQSDAVEMDTAAVDDSSDGQTIQPWTDLLGNFFRPVLVSGKVGDSVVIAGLALLTADDDLEISDTGVHLVAELASFLVRSGDSAIADPLAFRNPGGI